MTTKNRQKSNAKQIKKYMIGLSHVDLDKYAECVSSVGYVSQSVRKVKVMSKQYFHDGQLLKYEPV